MTVYTVKEVAEMLKLNIVTIRRHIESGKLKAIKVGSVWRITEEELQRFMDES